MDQVEAQLEENAQERGGGSGPIGTSPDPDGPGNAAWQRVKDQLARDAERRRQ